MRTVVSIVVFFLFANCTVADHNRLHQVERNSKFNCGVKIGAEEYIFTFEGLDILSEENILWNRPLTAYGGFSEYSIMVYIKDGTREIFFGYKYLYKEGGTINGSVKELLNNSSKVSYFVDQAGLFPGPSWDELDFDFVINGDVIAIQVHGEMVTSWQSVAPDSVILWYFNHSNEANSCVAKESKRKVKGV